MRFFVRCRTKGGLTYMHFGKNCALTRSLQSMLGERVTLKVRDFLPCRLVEKKSRSGLLPDAVFRLGMPAVVARAHAFRGDCRSLSNAEYSVDERRKRSVKSALSASS